MALTAATTVTITGATTVAGTLFVTGASYAGGVAAGASAGSVVPGIGTVIGAVVGALVSILMSPSGPKDYEIADWKASAQEAINPDLAIKSVDGRTMNAIASVAASGDTAKAKAMMREALSNTALGKIAQITGLSGLFDSAVALMNNRITRIRNDFKPGELEHNTEDNIKTGDTLLDNATNKYLHLKNKLKDCYIRKDQDCVSDVSQEIRNTRNGLIMLATNKFNEQIAKLNKEIHALEIELSKAIAEGATARANILRAKIDKVTGTRNTMRKARDQYQDVARSCGPGKEWHFVDHYCIDISKNKAHCEGGGGTWHGSLVTGGTGCTCDKKPGGHWMGNHCEYGFNQQQEQQLRLKDAADGCRHKIGNWRWDGHNCVEVSTKEVQKQREARAARYADDSEGE
jgi:hypothetical protein